MKASHFSLMFSAACGMLKKGARLDEDEKAAKSCAENGKMRGVDDRPTGGTEGPVEGLR